MDVRFLTTNIDYKVIIMVKLESSKDALVHDINSSETVASQIALNLQGEYDAIEGYYKLIPFLRDHNDREAVEQIREIISDEKNHAMLLNEIMMRYDGDIPVAED